MTPERHHYDKVKVVSDFALAEARRRINNLILDFEAAGIVVTVENESLWPPAMGNTNMAAKVGLAYHHMRELEALRLAAEQSEKGQT